MTVKLRCGRRRPLRGRRRAPVRPLTPADELRVCEAALRALAAHTRAEAQRSAVPLAPAGEGRE
jgi:hypothetical protein